MIFRIKHCWWLALIVTIVGVGIAWAIGAFNHFSDATYSWRIQIAIGVGGGLAALLINAVLHETFKRTIGQRYVRAFENYGHTVLDGMHWPAYLTGGLMAAVAEEPLFRGLLLPLVQEHTGSAVIAILLSALVFAICHWLRTRYLPFWFWAMWEGVIFGILTVYTGSILPAIIAHGLHDVIAYRIFASLLRGDKPGSTEQQGFA